MLALDHLTILWRDPGRSRACYDQILPELGFERAGEDIWRQSREGLHIQFRKAKAETRPYERYGAGLNHFGFKAPDVATVDRIAAQLAKGGHEARRQQFPDGTVALFAPDPDGLRLEVAWYPPGVPPVE
jgi:catechol 2,3-dioxygenase-like lactoylglutathione lyase family enzyme